LIRGKRKRRSLFQANKKKAILRDDSDKTEVGESTPCKRIQTDLLRAREELVELKNRLLEMTAELMQSQQELRRQLELNEIAQAYIPEEKLDDYTAACPNRQPLWSE
jgi:hypothetical protein